MVLIFFILAVSTVFFLVYLGFQQISYFASQIFIIPGTRSSSHEEKKADKGCIFSRKHKVWMRDILKQHYGTQQFTC